LRKLIELQWVHPFGARSAGMLIAQSRLGQAWGGGIRTPTRVCGQGANHSGTEWTLVGDRAKTRRTKSGSVDRTQCSGSDSRIRRSKQRGWSAGAYTTGV